ncbi:hypothetical protein [Virgibacillus alimentarius]|uniref:hypothetical protein n=1 Tax=Virgibacillus alimentarius TaxID=698769 RepID=UPI00049353BF|nr:hypothetical protein [Virgibacillus alimentarius]
MGASTHTPRAKKSYSITKTIIKQLHATDRKYQGWSASNRGHKKSIFDAIGREWEWLDEHAKDNRSAFLRELVSNARESHGIVK